MAPRETKNNAYAKFWGDKQRTLWYVTVISGVVNSSLTLLSFLKFSMNISVMWQDVQDIF